MYARLISRVGSLLIFAIVLAACSDNSSVGTSNTPVPNNSILGDGSHFDPIVAYPDIAKYAGANLELSSISYYFVHSDGTLDLNANYNPHVYYSFFQRLDAPPTDAPPIGAGGKLNEKWYQPVSVNVNARENGDAPKLNRYDGKPTNTTQQAIPAPTCSLKRLWSVALEKGAPKTAVATIYYDDRGYSFRISDTSVSLQFDNQCQYLDGTGLTPEPGEPPTVAPPA